MQQKRIIWLTQQILFIAPIVHRQSNWINDTDTIRCQSSKLQLICCKCAHVLAGMYCVRTQVNTGQSRNCKYESTYMEIKYTTFSFAMNS